MFVMNALKYSARMLRGLLRDELSLVTVKIHPTYRCNLRCTYCNLPNLKTPELTTDQWLAVIDELADIGCRRIAISGGEPLLRQDVADIIARVRERGMSCAMTSNGVLVKRRIDDLRPLNTLALSLDAAGPENDEVRGEGVLDAVIEAISAAKGVGIAVRVNAVVSNRTAHLLDDLLEFIDEHDLYLTVTVVRSGVPDLHHKAADVKPEDDEIRKTLLRLAELTQTNSRLLFSETTYRYSSSWRDYSRDRYEAGELASDDPLLRNGPRCQAGRYYLTIAPDGTVYPCCNTLRQIPGGNVITDGVVGPWRSLHDHRCVACHTCCQVEHNYLFSLQPRVVANYIAKHLTRFA